MEKADRGHVTRYDIVDVVERLKVIHGERFVQYRRDWDETCKGEEAS